MVAAAYGDRVVAVRFLAVLLAQVHLSVAFLAAAMALWALADDRASLRWSPLLVGALLGALPALPWLFDWMQNAGGGGGGRWRLPILMFWARWFTQPFGFGADYTLGAAHFREFLTGPAIGGMPSYLVALLHASLAGLAVMLYVRAGLALRARGVPGTRQALLGTDATGLLVRAALIGYGGVLTVVTIAGAGSHRHYLIIVAPLMALWVARLADVRRRRGAAAARAAGVGGSVRWRRIGERRAPALHPRHAGDPRRVRRQLGRAAVGRWRRRHRRLTSATALRLQIFAVSVSAARRGRSRA